MAEAAVIAAIFLLEKVGALYKQVNRQKDVKDDIEHIQKWLETIQAYLRDKRGEVGRDMLRNRIKQLRDIAYDIEDVLDEFQVKYVPHFHQHTFRKTFHDVGHYLKQLQPVLAFRHRNLTSKIKHVRAKIDENAHLYPVPGECSTSPPEVEHHTTNQIIYLQEDEIVGFKKHKAKLMEQIQDAGEASSIIAVVGAPGSGKSLLVKSLYKDKSVASKYGFRAWIHVSRSFKTDVQEELKHILNQESYLLVLDDLWDTDDWTRIVNALPSHFGRRRIIITTRDSDVANRCVLSGSKLHVHELQPLSKPDDWNLFCKKAFTSNNGNCPRELEKMSRDILKKCEGLPFAIVAIGSLLSTRGRSTPYEFQKLLNSIGSEMETGANLSIIGKVLQPSYNHLPVNLQSCFLYFSIFPEDYPVKRGRLIRLWIAEGFIKKKTGKTLEMVAEDYLNELIGRNLVQVSSWDFDGRPRTCRVRSLVREFLIQKSDEENFVTILTEPSTLQGESSSSTSLCSNIRKSLDQFKFLKVLDLEGAPLGIFPEEIFKLTLLKYLSLRKTKIKEVPTSIKKLAFLETLNLKYTEVTVLPLEILALKFLRHLVVYCYKAENSVQGVDVQSLASEFGTLSELQKLGLIKVTSAKVIEGLGALTNLKKLGLLVGLRKEDGKKLCEAIMKMHKLLSLDVTSIRQDQYLELDEMPNCPQFLQRLSLKGRLSKLPRWISSLDSLVKISLRGSKLSAKPENNPLTALEALPNLLELQMVDSYMGESWSSRLNRS
ncbi:Disease resistance protein [Corchorus capsularis]|uniref:Disease resistance protein n=1 Tax=Corchorus capsularis TaxID=210143 RepID=A0A1R3I990_COCAP|nr:Disease resistance protein [Corchorus capsularis]